MRRSLLLLAVCWCAACAPTAQGPVSTQPVITAPFTGDGAQALAKAGAPDAPTYEQMLRLFGPPDVSRLEGRGGLLSYRLAGCALALAFATDAAGALRLAAIEAGPLTPRDPKPTLATCAAQASARRNAGPNS